MQQQSQRPRQRRKLVHQMLQARLQKEKEKAREKANPKVMPTTNLRIPRTRGVLRLHKVMERRVRAFSTPRVCAVVALIVLIVMRASCCRSKGKGETCSCGQAKGRCYGCFGGFIGGAAAYVPPTVQEVYQAEWALDSGAGEHLASREALVHQGIPHSVIEECETCSSLFFCSLDF